MFSESQITFWTWLGWFIGQFSTLENVMQRTLWFYSGVDEPVAKALFSGIKIDASIQQIRFMISEKPLDDLSSKALDHALRQAADINKVRNDLLHHGAFFVIGEGDREEDLVISNDRLLRTSGKLRRTLISALDLYKMGDDIRRINVILHLVMQCYDQSQNQIEAELKQPWLYKPRQPRKKNHTPHPAPQSRRRRRGSSPA